MANSRSTATTVAKTNSINNNLEKNIMHNPILKSASAMTPVSEITRTRKSNNYGVMKIKTFIICIVLAGFYYTNTAFAGAGDSHATNPNTVINEIAFTVNTAEFTVNVFAEGNLSVDIYDLSGAHIMNVVQDKFLNKNAELRVPLTLGNLSSGMYTVMVSMGNDKIMKQIIIVK